MTSFNENLLLANLTANICFHACFVVAWVETKIRESEDGDGLASYKSKSVLLTSASQCRGYRQ